MFIIFFLYFKIKLNVKYIKLFQNFENKNLPFLIAICYRNNKPKSRPSLITTLESAVYTRKGTLSFDRNRVENLLD